MDLHPIIAPRPQITSGTNTYSTHPTQVQEAVATSSNAKDPRRGLATKHSEKDWDAIRPEVTTLFKDKKLNPKDIEDYFKERNPPFVANKRQWERRLEKWKLRPNVPKEKKAAMNKLKDRRLESYGKKTEFRYMGRTVPIHKLDRDKGSSSDQTNAYSVPTPSAISDVTVLTPRDMDSPRDFPTPKGPQTPRSTTINPVAVEEMSSEMFWSSSHQDSFLSVAPHHLSSMIGIAKDPNFGGQSPATTRLETPVVIRSPNMSSITPSILISFGGDPKGIQDHSNFNSTNLQASQSSMTVGIDMDLLNMPPPSNTRRKPQAQDRHKKEKELRAKLEETEQKFGKDHKETLPIMEELCGFLSKQGKYKYAEVLAIRVWNISEAIFGDHPRTLFAAIILGAIITHQARYTEGLRYILASVEALESRYPEDKYLYYGYENLSLALHNQNKDLEKAEFFARKAVSLSVKSFGVDLKEYYQARVSLAYVLMKQGKLDAALTEMHNVLEGYCHLEGEEHIDIINLKNALAQVLRKKGHLMEALIVVTDNKAIAMSALGPEHKYSLNCIHEEDMIYSVQRIWVGSSEVSDN